MPIGGIGGLWSIMAGFAAIMGAPVAIMVAAAPIWDMAAGAAAMWPGIMPMAAAEAGTTAEGLACM